MAGQVVGYARVSSAGQSLKVQRQKLEEAGCVRIFEEKRSGAHGSVRPELKRALDYVREGDTLIISRLDRMARSTLDLLKIVELLREDGVALKVLDQSLDTSTSEGRLLVRMLAAIAEFENDIRRERQADGIAKAKDAGVTFGRKRVLSKGQLRELQQLRAEGASIGDLQRRYGIGRSTVYRALSGSQAHS